MSIAPPDLDHLRRQIPDDVIDVCRTLRDAHHEAWLVGGAVRDLLRGRTGKDFDIATSAHPEEVTRVFGRRRVVPTGAKHGTVTVLTDHGSAGEHRHVEVTTFRGEGAYSDGRRPDSVSFVSELVEDLRRRDFTINAIAFDPFGPRLADPFGGQADLAARVIRAVGDARERFREDGLRIMRAVRFCAQLEFALDPATEAAIPGALDVFRKVSQERVRDELCKTLGAPIPSLGLVPMQRSGILGAALPEVAQGVGHAQNRWHAYDVWMHTVVAVDQTPGDGSAEHAILRLGTLLHDVAKPRTAVAKDDAPGEYSFFNHEIVGAEMAEDVCRRLKLANKERERIVALVRHHMFWYSPDWSDATVRRFIGKVGIDLVPDLFALRHGDVCGRGRGEDPSVETAELFRRIQAEVAASSALKITDLAIGGGDVMRILACPPGRTVGDVLKKLLERVLEDPALNTAEGLCAMVPEVAREVGAARS